MNMWTLPQPKQVFYGLQLFAHFQFGPANADLGFSSAGADFNMP